MAFQLYRHQHVFWDGRNRQVYAIVQRPPVTVRHHALMETSFFTAPYLPRIMDRGSEVRNVLVTFVDPHHARVVKDMLPNTETTEVQPYVFKDLSYLANVLDMSMVVVVRGLCDIQDKELRDPPWYELYYVRYEPPLRFKRR